MNFTLLLSLFLAYLIGAIPFGYLFVRVFTGDDVRRTGSGGTGATNVTRKAGIGIGLLTYLCDMVKGLLAVYLVAVPGNPHTAGAAALLAILGHMFPVFIGFRGGKGVATAVGVFLMISPWATLAALGVWAFLFAVTRIVSLGSILATALFPVFVWVFGAYLAPSADWPVTAAWAVAIAAVIIGKHHENIRRLVNGTEGTMRRGARRVSEAGQ